jgi:hypothetical protein
MTPTRPGPLAAVTVVCAALAWLVIRETFATLPPLPWTAVPALLLLALGESVAGYNLRARMAGRRPAAKPIEPIGVARLAALAKASSVVAAAVGGVFAGFGIYVAAELAKDVPRHDAIVALVTVACAAGLLAAALYLERCCRSTGGRRDEEDAPEDRRADWH